MPAETIEPVWGLAAVAIDHVIVGTSRATAVVAATPRQMRRPRPAFEVAHTTSARAQISPQIATRGSSQVGAPARARITAATAPVPTADSPAAPMASGFGARTSTHAPRARPRTSGAETATV